MESPVIEFVHGMSMEFPNFAQQLIPAPSVPRYPAERGASTDRCQAKTAGHAARSGGAPNGVNFLVSKNYLEAQQKILRYMNVDYICWYVYYMIIISYNYE
jgi:hypothetical protein